MVVGDVASRVGDVGVAEGECGDVDDWPCRGVDGGRCPPGLGDERVGAEGVGSVFTGGRAVAAELWPCASSTRTSVSVSVLGALVDPWSRRDTALQEIVAARAVASVQLVAIRKRRASVARVWAIVQVCPVDP